MTKMHSVYLVQGPTGVYIGYTSQCPKKRFNTHMCKKATTGLAPAVAKYGPRAFSYLILEQYEAREEALSAEMFWIEYFRSIGARLYNWSSGGQFSEHSALSRKKIGDASRNHWESPEYREKMIARDKTSWTDPDKRAKILAGRLTEEGRKNRSEATKKLWQDPDFRKKMEGRRRD